MFRTIQREEIRQHLQAKTPMILIEALPEKYYRDGHLPGAIRLGHDEIRQRAAEVLPDRDAFIVVYCANTPCQNSLIAARTLDALGYTNVGEYVEGKQDWVEAGLPLETSAVEQAA
ncbi:MAG TPA: rhodanese-like domain-containing protein [Burkholderiales bacterium]|nr:rhodanese-like domain-containing protein [Burkholderiales bacterium]